MMPHPSEQVLAAYGLGGLAGREAEGVQRHLRECAGCRGRIAQLSASRSGAQGPGGAPATGITAGVSAALRAMPLREAPEIPAELLTLSQYAEVRELGRGGMGVVYVARNTDLDRLEALKVMQRSTLERAGSGTAERFLREMQAAAKLQHPNVVTAYAVYRPGGLIVFAMEYAPGRDLAKVVRAKGPLPVPVACSYIHAAAAGLQHAHDAKMVHRDIKPGNLILTKVNGKPAVKVLDFGLAKVAGGAPGAADLTGDGAMMGTPAYMAPEQATDAARADIRADIYSLGCTLYYLLAGRPPFEGGSAYAVVALHQTGTATPLDELQPAVPRELAQAVATMMARDPADRFQTPAEAARAIRPFVALPATAPAPSASHHFSAVETSRPQQTAPERPASDDSDAPTPPRPQSATRTTRPAWLVPVAVVALSLVGLAGAYFAGAFSLKTPNGTVVVENVPDGADISVEGATVTVARKGEAVTVGEVPADGKGHRLRVTKDGVELFARDVTVTVGTAPVRVRYVPRDVAPAPKPSPAPATPPAPPQALDKLVAGSVWHGTRTYTEGAWAPATVNYELHIDKRDGTKFSGRKYDNGTGRNKAEVEGEVAGNTVRWTEKTDRPADGVYQTTGTFNGDSIRASQLREVSGKFSGRASIVLRLLDAGKGTRKGDPASPPAEAEPPPADPKPAAKEAPEPEGFVPLFNGNDKTGWSVPAGTPDEWSVADGVLSARGPQKETHLFTDAEYGDFHLRAEFRVNAGGNSGVLFRSAPPGKADGGVYEAEISYPKLVNQSTIPTGSLFASGKLVAKSDAPGGRADEWCTLEVLAVGNAFTVRVNGATAASYTDPGRAGARGRIGVQKRDPLTAVEFRKIEVKELKAAGPPAPAGADGFVPLFNGKDLAGFRTEGGALGAWSFAAGELTGRSKNHDTRTYLVSDKKYADFTIRFEARVEAGGAGAVALRAIDGETVPSATGRRVINHPMIKLLDPPNISDAPSGTANWVWNGSDARPSPAPDLPAGRWHRVEVTVAGDRCTAVMGGKQVWDERLSADRASHRGIVPALGRPEGRVGFQVHNGAVRFRDAEIKELAAPTKPATPAVPSPARGEFVPLFNGKDLTGWYPKPDRPGNWRVEGGALVASGEPMGLLLSDRGDYQNFHARARVMINEPGDSGLYFRNSAAGGYEAQICCTPGRPNLTGTLFRFPPGNNVLERVGSARTKPGEWFDLDVIAEGDRVRILIDGAQAVDRTVKVNPLTKGGFALQQANAATEVRFRSVEVKELPPGPAPQLQPGSATPARPKVLHVFAFERKGKPLGDPKVSLLDGGRAYGQVKEREGTWELTDGGKKLVLRWPEARAPGGVWIDTYTSSDGVNFEGLNNNRPPVALHGVLSTPP